MWSIPTRYTILMGFMSRFVLFVVSFLFVESTGQFGVPQPLFKSLMVVVFGGFGSALLVAAFQQSEPTPR